MRKHKRIIHPLFLTSMIICALLLAGSGCSSKNQSNISGTLSAQSSGTGSDQSSDTISSQSSNAVSGQSSDTASDQSSDTTSSQSSDTDSDQSSGAASGQSSEADGSATVSDKVADAGEMVEAVDVVDPGMIPVHADDLLDGIYPVAMRSSSSMFKADHVKLEVKDGSMQAYLFMTSQSYVYMFPGTAQDAANANEDQYIPLEKTALDGEELEAFRLPVAALDDGLSFSSYSRRKEKWYDRTLLFEADSLPVEAFRNPPFTQLSDLNLTDGDYIVDVTLEGGSGRASVTSPASLTVSGGKATAHIVWSSSNYVFMMVGEEKYLPVADESGNSAFDIPVAYFDHGLSVKADTTAMSQPHLIDYSLTFNSSSIAKAG